MGFAAWVHLGEAGKRPWQRRIGKDVETRHRLAYQAMDPAVWPEEPPAPKIVEVEGMKRSLQLGCGQMPPDRLEKYAEGVIREAKRFEIDPFLLAALMVHQSQCRPRTPDRETRLGLTRIDVEMHAPHIRGGEYRYFLEEKGVWRQHALPMPEHRFNQWSVQKPLVNLYFAAAILSVWKKQCRDLDAAFNGSPHRHYISHWFFGDRVKESQPEDSVLAVRRRLLDYYMGVRPAAAGTYEGTPIFSPLHGAPRLVLDYFGNKRGNKTSPGHMGIDIPGLTGEPVMAVADGRISFAGVDLPQGESSRQTTPEEAAAIPVNALGKGGIWITLNHGNGFRTCYMHLDSLAVKTGDKVKAGDVIGTLGKTGTTTAGPHLHLEFRKGNGGREDPAVPLKRVLVNPFLKPAPTN